MNHLANAFIELEKFPLHSFGSLYKPGECHVGAFARESLTDYVQSEMRALGPFSSLEEYHVSSLKMILRLILQDELYSQRAVDAYLIHRFLLDLVPLVLPTVQSNGEFFLKHADDKGDHILVDENFDVTGIIDWEWAHTAPPALAFNSPIGLLPVADFYDGKNCLGDDEAVFALLFEEKGREDLAQFVRHGRLQHRFAFCCGYDLCDWDGFLGLFRGLREALGVDEGMDWDEWKNAALQRFNSDPGLLRLLGKEC